MTDNRTFDNKTPLGKDDTGLLYALGEATGDLPTEDEVRKAWAAFEAKREAETRRKRRAWAAGLLSAAAAIALVFVIFAPSGAPTKEATDIEAFTAMELPGGITRSTGTDYVAISTPKATTTAVNLPDGTHVLLGAGSTIEYPKNMGEQSVRQVKLSGQARFDVRHDARRPFIVKAGGITTRVLGTVFDISSYPGARRSVTLYSGKVAVDDGDGRHTTILSPGQRATVSGGNGLSVAAADLDAASGWARGMFIFDDERLADAMAEIGSWYNVSVVFTSRKALDVRIHFNMPRSITLQEMVRALNDMGMAKFRITGDKITVA